MPDKLTHTPNESVRPRWMQISSIPLPEWTLEKGSINSRSGPYKKSVLGSFLGWSDQFVFFVLGECKRGVCIKVVDRCRKGIIIFEFGILLEKMFARVALAQNIGSLECLKTPPYWNLGLFNRWPPPKLHRTLRFGTKWSGWYLSQVFPGPSLYIRQQAGIRSLLLCLPSCFV